MTPGSLLPSRRVQIGGMFVAAAAAGVVLTGVFALTRPASVGATRGW